MTETRVRFENSHTRLESEQFFCAIARETAEKNRFCESGRAVDRNIAQAFPSRPLPGWGGDGFGSHGGSYYINTVLIVYKQ